MAVIRRAQDEAIRWATRDPNPDGPGTHPSYWLAEVDGEDLAVALTLSAVALGQLSEAPGGQVGMLVSAQEITDLLLTETVARLTGGGGPGA
jgi:hypothetical protein